MTIIPNIELKTKIGYSIFIILFIFKYLDDANITNIPEIIISIFINVDR